MFTPPLFKRARLLLSISRIHDILICHECIYSRWGSWKKIQQVIPGRTKDQCKSHAQKFLKNHSNEKDRLIAEHRNMFMMQRCRDGKSKSNNKPSTRSVLRAKKKAVSKNELIPIMTAQAANNKVLKKKRSNENESENLHHTSSFQKERLSSEVGGEGGGSYHNHEEFNSADSIDAICNEIYERKLKSGCKRFPLCLCEKTPCVRDGLLYQFGVRGHQPL
mmetsp:Transcript_16174/g.34190  ORF Transcript_16174/g.34190 Transcript_16174/m.34190 type:complete len:220 (-) Transcript_16174:60-719(-)